MSLTLQKNKKYLNMEGKEIIISHEVKPGSFWYRKGAMFQSDTKVPYDIHGRYMATHAPDFDLYSEIIRRD